MKVKISKENWINATTDIKGKFWCPIERQESLLNVWPNSVDIEIEVDKPKTKKVKINDGLLGAIARGWCHKKNSSKVMDSDLAVAIAEEVQKYFEQPELATQPQPIKEESKCDCWRQLDKESMKGKHGDYCSSSKQEESKDIEPFKTLFTYSKNYPDLCATQTPEFKKWVKQVTDTLNSLTKRN